MYFSSHFFSLSLLNLSVLMIAFYHSRFRHARFLSWPFLARGGTQAIPLLDPFADRLRIRCLSASLQLQIHLRIVECLTLRVILRESDIHRMVRRRLIRQKHLVRRSLLAYQAAVAHR